MFCNNVYCTSEYLSAPFGANRWMVDTEGIIPYIEKIDGDTRCRHHWPGVKQSKASMEPSLTDTIGKPDGFGDRHFQRVEVQPFCTFE
jgi:hypothetical protein